MSAIKKPPGNIHKIREFELEKITLSDEFDILQIVGEGWFGKILLAEHRATDTEMVLKALPKPYVSLRDFYREFHYGLHLGIHKNIVTTYDVAFETAGFYVFTQEYALLGDLTSNVSDSGIGELHSKKVAKQIASALDYMHSKDLVHRDVKLDNVLIYKSDFSRVKLCDFGESFRTGTIVERRNEWLPYSPPEVLQIKPEGTYPALPSHDVWQFAIVIFVCLTGCLPWQKAASDDPRYVRYLAWQGVNMMIPLRRTPKLFKLLSGKGSRMFRKFLEPRPERRPKNLCELSRFLDDRWLAKGAEKDMAEYEPDELCPSMYSFHSSPEEKNRVLWSLAEHGIETTVDRKAKKIRIKDWIESSVILEDDEEEDSGSASASPSSSVSREPVPGHISSVRTPTASATSPQKINTTIKDASNKHFDPRTGIVQQGPSEMGTIYRNQSLGNISVATIGPNSVQNSSLNSSLITLGSRNNLILSEGQPFNSDMNLLEDVNPLDGDMVPMVNARLKNLPLFNTTSNNSHIYSNTQGAELMQKIKIQSLSNSDLTQLVDTNSNTTLARTPQTNTNQLPNIFNNNNNNNSSSNSTNRNGRKPMQIKRTKSDSVKNVLLAGSNLLSNENPNFYASTSAINLINNNNNINVINSNNNNSRTGNTNNNNNNNNNNNSINNSGKKLVRPFQSIATISVPEVNSNSNQQRQDEYQKQFVTSQENTKQTTTTKISGTNSDKIIMNPIQQGGNTGKRLASPVFNARRTMTVATDHQGFFSKINGVLSRSQTNLLSSSIKNGQLLSLPKRRVDESAQTTITMKDTPYDRVKKL